ncbi:hypothetical protein Tco_1393236 [Tanacetum coccineum]
MRGSPTVPIATVLAYLFPFSIEGVPNKATKKNPSIHSNLGRSRYPNSSNQFFPLLSDESSQGESPDFSKSTNYSTQAVSSALPELKDIGRALLLDKMIMPSAPAPSSAPVKAVKLSWSRDTPPGFTVTNPSDDLKGITYPMRCCLFKTSNSTSSVVKLYTECTKDHSAPFLITKYRTRSQHPVGPEKPYHNSSFETSAPGVAPCQSLKTFCFLYLYPSRRDNEK